MAHISDAEIVYAGRYRWILAHDQPELIGYDQDLWVDRLHQPVEDAAQLLALFEPLRQANLALWRGRLLPTASGSVSTASGDRRASRCPSP